MATSDEFTSSATGNADGLQPHKRSMNRRVPAMRELGERRFTPDAASVGEARHFVAQVLAECPDQLIQDVQLIVSELATNCVVYARTPFTVRISLSADHARIEVGDTARGVPVLRRPKEEQVRGRGLVITDALSTAWGVEQRGQSEKVVWASVPAHDGGFDRTASG
jgi:anti-sigma regulatory factor (Ser/Thr protein kinase)